MENPDLVNVDKICRACLIERQNMYSIYDVNVKEMFLYCTSLTVSDV